MVKKWFLTGLLVALATFAFVGAAGEIYKKGIAAQASQDFEKAAELFRQSIESEGETPEALNNLGYCLSNISKNYANEAYKQYKKVLKSNPNNEETLGYLGELYIWQGNIIKANQILAQLKKLESTEAEALEQKLGKIVAQLKTIGR